MDPVDFASFFSSEEMESIFLESLGPALLARNFEYCGKCRWARQTPLEFKHLFFLYPFRPGADYFPHGAISFDFVPRIAAGKVRFRSDAKHARVHLTVVHYDLSSNRRIGRDRSTARETCTRLAEPVVDHVSKSLAMLKSLEDVVERFQRERWKSHDFYAYPEMALAFAFTLAKLGRVSEAKSELANALKSSYFPEETHLELQKLLDITRS